MPMTGTSWGQWLPADSRVGGNYFCIISRKALPSCEQQLDASEIGLEAHWLSTADALARVSIIVPVVWSFMRR